MQSQLLNWPDEIPRTPTEDREVCNKFSTGLTETRKDLREEMERMGVEEWYVEEVSGSGGDPGVVVRWIDDGQEYAAACDNWTTKTANLRSTYMWINETRMREKRPVSTARDSFAAARLPSGNQNNIVAAEEPPHATLGVNRDASQEEIKEAYRERVKESHPDSGGDPEEFERIQNAYEQLTEGDG